MANKKVTKKVTKKVNKKVNKKERQIIFHDTETTGIDYEDRIVSSAFMIKLSDKRYYIKEDLSNPRTVMIKPDASMTNGITNKMISDSPKFEKTSNYKVLNMANHQDFVYMAYNAYFDLNMLSKEGIIWKEENVLDLYRVAKHLFKDSFIEDLSPFMKMKRRNEELEAEFRGEELKPQIKTKLTKFKLQYFRSLLEFDDQEDFKELLSDLRMKEIIAHEAKSDIIIMYYFYLYIKKEFNLSLEDMLLLSRTPVLEDEIHFGGKIEHGTTFEEAVDIHHQYFDWYLNNTDPMLDREFTCKYHIAKGIIDKRVKMQAKYVGHLNYSILFAFNKEEQEMAHSLIDTDKDLEEYVDWLKNSYIKIGQKNIEKNIENKENNNKTDNLIFLLRYLNFKK